MTCNYYYEQIQQSNTNISSDVEVRTSVGLIVLACVFGCVSVLVVVFMVYIVRRVRHRHLYMQSDINHGGVFSVLYGHAVNRPSVPLQHQCDLTLSTNVNSTMLEYG
jgi:hypothetical protein